jgi:hypothetical protein
VGIGGDPVALLRRCGTLVRPGGLIVVEVEPPGAGWRHCRARLERGGERGAWFPWSVVGADAVAELGRASELGVHSVEPCSGRWFARLQREGIRGEGSRREGSGAHAYA